MTSKAGSSSAGHSGSGQFWVALLVLLGILGAIFHQSFEADQVLFANDGPLGALMAYSDFVTSFFTGSWHTLNWIGVKQPSALPDFNYGIYLVWGPLMHARFFAPLTLLILGQSVWLLFRQLRFRPAVCILGGLAAALNTDPFSYACWGLPTLPLTMATVFFALAALASAPHGRGWLKIVLAGLALGLGIMEGYDNGAIFSLYVAAFVLFQAWVEPGPTAQRLAKGSIQVAAVAVCAAWMAAHALSTLVGTQIKGVVGMQQDERTKEQRWDEATMWSLPKIETLRVIIPGLYGYRMDTPDGGNYWGSVGQYPGNPKTRHSGSGVYGGVLVVLIAIWGLVRAGRSRENPFSERERRFIWFWAGMALVSLLLAYGRHAPFYQFFYRLPYFSTIRNPIKFMHPFHLALVILFGYGLQGLYRQYLERNLLKSASFAAQWKEWWAAAPAIDHRWTIGSLATVGGGILAWLLYASSRSELRHHLEEGGFPLELAANMARFSYTEVGWFILFLALAVGVVLLISSGALSGPRVTWATLLLGLVLVTDFSRANSPWIVYYNYKEKYASNGVIDFLRDKPYEHRVAARLMPKDGGYLATDYAWPELYQVFLEHHFQYYRIQTLDIIQMPRMPEFDYAYLSALRPKNATNISSVGRLWQLTNTRYVLGMRPFLDLLNQQIDPVHKSFRVHSTFGAGAQFALFEFGAALPRAKLFQRWQVITNDDSSVLKRLADPAFDPNQIVLVSDPLPTASPNPSTNQSPAVVRIAEYEPKHVALTSDAAAATVLLLNDRYDPDWRVSVDGKPGAVLRCNYIMRGVVLPPGRHTIEFRYDPPAPTLYVSLAALAAGFVLCGILLFLNGPAQENGPSESQSAKDLPERRTPIPHRQSNGPSGKLPT